MKQICKLCILSFVAAAVIACTGAPINAPDVSAAPQKEHLIPGRSTQDKEKRTGVDDPVTCPEPRPEICTMDYQPVCARIKDGGYKTYSNGCTSCADPNVVGYRKGECKPPE